VALSGCVTKKPAIPIAPTARFEPVKWSKLPGWKTDDALAAWPALLSSCSVIAKRPEWTSFCGAAIATSPGDAEFVRSFMEQHLTPYRVLRLTGRKKEKTGLVTGYYEPLLRGSRERTDQFQTPLYRRPDDLLIVDLSAVIPELKGKRVRGRLDGNKVVPYYSRAGTRHTTAAPAHARLPASPATRSCG
jgi:membrane-bound lytic murein transglycosylase A